MIAFVVREQPPDRGVTCGDSLRHAGLAAANADRRRGEVHAVSDAGPAFAARRRSSRASWRKAFSDAPAIAPAGGPVRQKIGIGSCRHCIAGVRAACRKSSHAPAPGFSARRVATPMNVGEREEARRDRPGAASSVDHQQGLDVAAGGGECECLGEDGVDLRHCAVYASPCVPVPARRLDGLYRASAPYARTRKETFS